MNVIKHLITMQLILSVLKRCVPPRNFGPTLKAKNKISVVLVHCMLREKHSLIPKTWQMLLITSLFILVFTHKDLSSWPNLNEDSSFPDMPPIHIHPHGVEQLLSGLKLHNASGPDMIPTYLLKLLAHQLAYALTLLYQAS